MTTKDGKPCKKCGTSNRYANGNCKRCKALQSDNWKRNNPDKVKARRDRHYRNNRERIIDDSKKWKRNNPEKVSAFGRVRISKIKKNGGTYTPDEWHELCEYYGNKCLRCGRDDVKLTFDHVIPVSKGGSSDISNGQPLCARCNTSKGDKHIDYRPDAGPLRWLQARLFG